MSNIAEGKCFETTMLKKALRVDKQLGFGGQGTVWNCTYAGSKNFVLKVIDNANEAIKSNVKIHREERKKLPQCFVWPLDLVYESDNEIAYVMEKVPGNFRSLEKFLWPDGGGDVPAAMFANMDVKLLACVNIVEAFHELHIQGQFYQDLNEGNFMIDPETGEVRIIDTDNICDGRNDTKINGTPGYMAPEIVLRESRPNLETDLFSMAIILFSIMCCGNPMIGLKVRSDIIRDDEKVFGREPVFVYDDNDESNRPCEVLDAGVLCNWPLCPPELQKAFKMAFSSEAIHEPQKRVKCFEWKEILLGVKARIIFCSNCGTYYSDSQDECPKCKTGKGKFLKIKTSNNDSYPIIPGKIFVEHNLCGNRKIKSVLKCAVNKSTKCLGIVNLSQNKWLVKAKGIDGSVINQFINPNSGMDIPENCIIDIELGGELKSISIDTRRI